MKLRVIKSGNSLALILPKSVADRFKIQQGDNLFAMETPEGVFFQAEDPDVLEAMERQTEMTREDREFLRALTG